jgi:hypothetical protein
MFEKIKQKFTASTDTEKAVLVEMDSERPDDPAAIEPKAPLAEAESILAWLITQPSAPENKALRAQAGIVVDYLKGA